MPDWLAYFILIWSAIIGWEIGKLVSRKLKSRRKKSYIKTITTINPNFVSNELAEDMRMLNEIYGEYIKKIATNNIKPRKEKK